MFFLLNPRERSSKPTTGSSISSFRDQKLSFVFTRAHADHFPLIARCAYRQFTLLIDNYDSFTHNLYQFLEQMGAHVRVVRNDQITLEEIQVSYISTLLM